MAVFVAEAGAGDFAGVDVAFFTMFHDVEALHFFLGTGA